MEPQVSQESELTQQAAGYYKRVYDHWSQTPREVYVSKACQEACDKNFEASFQTLNTEGHVTELEREAGLERIAKHYKETVLSGKSCKLLCATTQLPALKERLEGYYVHASPVRPERILHLSRPATLSIVEVEAENTANTAARAASYPSTHTDLSTNTDAHAGLNQDLWIHEHRPASLEAVISSCEEKLPALYGMEHFREVVLVYEPEHLIDSSERFVRESAEAWEAVLYEGGKNLYLYTESISDTQAAFGKLEQDLAAEDDHYTQIQESFEHSMESEYAELYEASKQAELSGGIGY